MARYSVLLIPDTNEGGFTVTVPLLPGCVTEGGTLEEALANAREAIQCHLEGLAADGLPLPAEADPPRLTAVEV